MCRFIFDVGLNEFGAHLWKEDGLLRFWNLKLNPGDESSYINALVGRVNGINGRILLYPFVKEGRDLSSSKLLLALTCLLR